ncbi:MAG: hypothetical protein K9N57_10420 [Candidatus Marinimicrobia bacterium]|nr:hypothetical protein [Candidatus Neomarinimicrobiota bacterium]
MRRLIHFSIFGFTLCLFTVMAFSYGRGPVNKKTGAPGEGICVQSDCHVSYELNSGPGTLILHGVPKVYEPGKLYPLTVELAQEGQERWGFQVTIINKDLTKSGEIVKYDDDLMQLDDDEVNDKERFYLNHTRDGTYRGTEDGPVKWNFTWRAPEKPQGVISFYTAGNAGNGNKKPTGDYIYQIVENSYPDSASVPTE